MTDIRDELIGALERHRRDFSVSFDSESVERLADYYEIVQRDNDLLHLVAPCSAAEFATRHILESLTLLAFLPLDARFVDVGAGAGLPSIPCLVTRGDLRAILIESKAKKAEFLMSALADLDVSDRAVVVSKQFAETQPGNETDYVTCRALDRFARNLRKLIGWSGPRKMLLFGGDALGKELSLSGRRFDRVLMPLSERRYLFVETGR